MVAAGGGEEPSPLKDLHPAPALWHLGAQAEHTWCAKQPEKGAPIHITEKGLDNLLQSRPCVTGVTLASA